MVGYCQRTSVSLVALHCAAQWLAECWCTGFGAAYRSCLDPAVEWGCCGRARWWRLDPLKCLLRGITAHLVKQVRKFGDKKYTC